jgi:hypothetical protein
MFKKICDYVLNKMFGTGPKYKGTFNVECRDRFGNLKWVQNISNGVANAGITDLLEQYFRTGTNRHPWYLGLISSSGYSALAAGDTAASHAGWTESSAYSNANRVAWGPAAAAAVLSVGTISNTTPAAFNINGTVTIKGVFLINENTKGGTTGILWATALFSGGDQAVVNGDTLNVTYTISAS